jgi:hypothetical protein
MQAMYSLSNFATHHIFFPPRLEIVAFQQHSNGLSAHARNQFAFDNFFGQQSHRPTRPSFRRRRADNGDNLLALALVKGRRFARTRGVEQRPIQSLFLIPCADLPHCLGRKPQVSADCGRGLSLIHLTQSQGAQNRAHGLQSAAQQLIQLPSIPLCKLNLKPLPSAHVSAIQPPTSGHKYQHWLPIHAVMVLAVIWLELTSDQANFQIADHFSRKCIEPPEASFGVPIATGSTFRNFGAMVRIPVVCSIMS